MSNQLMDQTLMGVRVTKGFKEELQKTCEESGVRESVFIRFSLDITLRQLRNEQGEITELTKEWVRKHDEKMKKEKTRSNNHDTTVVCPVCKCSGGLSIKKNQKRSNQIMINHRKSDGFNPVIAHSVGKKKFPDFWATHINDYKEYEEPKPSS